MSQSSNICRREGCILGECPLFNYCDEPLYCFSELAPVEYYTVALRIAQVSMEYNALCSDYHHLRHEFINLPPGAVNALGEPITSMDDYCYQYDEPCVKLEIKAKELELRELRREEHDLKKEWRRRILCQVSA